MGICNDPFCPIDSETGEAIQCYTPSEVECIDVRGPKQQISVRIATPLLAMVEDYAKKSGMERSKAINMLLASALKSTSENMAQGDVLDILRQSNMHLRASLSAISSQLSEKDQQIKLLIQKVGE